MVDLLLQYKLELILAMFLLLFIATVVLYYLDRAFRLRVQQKLSTASPKNIVATDRLQLKRISLARAAFIVGLVGTFTLLFFTYDTYQNQTLVRVFGFGVFLANLIGTYFFGSLKRVRQTEYLVNKLHLHIIYCQHTFFRHGFKV